jgi:hypothetical protein
MSEHQRHTEFLRQCILDVECQDRHELAKGISQVQRDARCVRRAAWLMAILIALDVACLAYATLFVKNFPDEAPQFIVNLICAVGLGSLFSLVAFVGLGLVYRNKLNQRREECRQRVAMLLKSRLENQRASSDRASGAS